jgi:mannose-1-phosphate guanylyltransferase/mannose-6-phosphate isomerase
MNKNLKFIPVLLSGGGGVRLWPISRQDLPKQFISIDNNETLFQESIKRVAKLLTLDGFNSEILIVTNEKYLHISFDQIKIADNSNLKFKFIIEPEPKNTAPSLTFAALEASKSNDDPILVIFPCDQKIDNEDKFIKKLFQAIKVLDKNTLIMLGVCPENANPGFGYINVCNKPKKNGIHTVSKFIEKPKKDDAKKLYKKKNFFWNSGIFMIHSSLWLKLIAEYRNDIYKSSKYCFDKSNFDNHNLITLNAYSYKKISSESIDYAVLEKAINSDIKIGMIEIDVGWSDMGTWDSILTKSKKNLSGNLIYGDVIANKTNNSFIYSNSRLIATTNVENLIIVETNDSLLVAGKGEEQDIKSIVNQLSILKRNEHISHKKIQRNWGFYEIIAENHFYKVKRIVVNPGLSLSLQKHLHRSEHWVVVKGAAEVVCGNSINTFYENQYAYIPKNCKHRLRNKTDSTLEVIEIQFGKYLGEDDILRY